MSSNKDHAWWHPLHTKQRYLCICEVPQCKELCCCLSSSMSGKGNSKKKKCPCSSLGMNFFPVYQYFNSRVHNSDSASCRKGWCELRGIICIESQVPWLREKEGLFSLQLKLHSGDKQTQTSCVLAAGFLPAVCFRWGTRELERPHQHLFSWCHLLAQCYTKSRLT